MNHTTAAIRGFTCKGCSIGVIGTWAFDLCDRCRCEQIMTAFSTVNRKQPLALAQPPRTLERRIMDSLDLLKKDLF